MRTLGSLTYLLPPPPIRPTLSEDLDPSYSNHGAPCVAFEIRYVSIEISRARTCMVHGTMNDHLASVGGSARIAEF